MGKRMPVVGLRHYGARARHSLIANAEGAGQTVEEAIEKVSLHLGRTLSRQEIRDFHYGWRMGAVTHATNTLNSVARYLDKKKLIELGDELVALAAKWEKQLFIEQEGD